MPLEKILIVDDEKIARDRVRRFLGEGFRVSEACDGVEALEKVASDSPDLIFLDVQMPGLNGFEFLAQLEARPFQIIFQTAFDEFALRAFDEAAVDYLLKPYSKERFQRALDRASTAAKASEDLRRLETTLRSRKTFLERLTVRKGGKLKVIECAAIEAFVSKDHCTLALVGDREIVIDLSIATLEERLDPARFVRCHRGAIAAIGEIASIGGTEDSHVVLKSGTKLELSRGCRKNVLQQVSGDL